jgi:outer membrane protein OmpA-like peptidoglycan-associated protein
LTPAVATAPAPQPAKAVPRQPEGDAAGVVGFRINFALDSAVVPDSADPFLDRLAELLKQEPQLALRIEGHTDAYGSDEYNLRLSERRATAVGLALVRRGIPAGRLAVAGKGKTEPLVADPMDGRNRRVQFLRLRPETTS